jgi:steroid delta-isomerase-like uncharacterized protein
VNKENEELIRKYYQEVMNEGQGDLVKFDEFVAPNAILHNSHPKPPVGPPEWKERIRFFTTAFSDVEISVKDSVSDGDQVVTHMIYQATHTDDFLGIPASGKRVAVDEIQIVKVQDGKIVERRSVIDMINLLAQIGADEIPGTYKNSTIPGT